MVRTVLVCLLLTGCATATRLNTGDGVIYRLECNGAAVPVSACYAKANKVCAAGWDQLATDGSVIPTGTQVADITYVGAIESKSVTVKCR
jgi:hypothetical protein